MAYNSPKAAHFPAFELDSGEPFPAKRFLELRWQLARRAAEIQPDLFGLTLSQRREINSLVESLNGSAASVNNGVQFKFEA